MTEAGASRQPRHRTRESIAAEATRLQDARRAIPSTVRYARGLAEISVRKRASRTSAGGSAALFVGIDTGGTFTDVVFRQGARSGVFKILSTPADPAMAVLHALRELFGERAADTITYGTTVATNAMLERRGAEAALLLTAGFEDTLEIGRQARPDLYALEPVRPRPLIPRSRCIGVRERIRHDGSVARPLEAGELRRLVREIRRTRAVSIGVCLLHAHVDPRHERALGRALRALGLPVTLSSDISPLRGEYERASTVAANAYVQPRVAGHLGSLSRRAGARSLRVMQSNGGAIGALLASKEPVRTMLSGPAGGVAAASEIARAAGFPRAISLDMGGTSTDVALIDAAAARRATTEIGGVPIRVPSLDIHTVGAGGGSIACVDAGGALRVGPESAGADPGPACYGRGQAPTVTDANVVLGRLRPDAFLGGRMRLDVARARSVMRGLARDMRTRSIEDSADGVIRVVQNNMERAIRFITVERGHDPRSCVLVPFGGAAGLHACGLADELGVRTILVPADPGVLSAHGMLRAPWVHDVFRTFLATDPAAANVDRAVERACKQARRGLIRQGVPEEAIRAECFVQVRYLGEGSTLEIPHGPRLDDRFRAEHSRLFHDADRDRPIECTAVRATAIAPVGERRARSRRSSRPAAGSRSDAAAIVDVWIEGKPRRAPLFARSRIGVRARITGPALVTEYSSTLFVAGGWVLRWAAPDHLVVER
jgi:N-methylhydantoinase A